MNPVIDADKSQRPQDNGETGNRTVRPKRAAQRSEGADLVPFPFQLRDAYIQSCTLSRREALDTDPARPRFETSFRSETAEDLPGFLAYLTVEVVFAFRPGATCTLSVCTTGVFKQAEAVPSETERQFIRDDCAVLLWPYARANVGEIFRMAGLQLPPLPTIDVRRALSNRAEPKGPAKG